MGFELLQDDIGGNFKGDVWNEEDCQGGIVLIARQVQVLL